MTDCLAHRGPDAEGYFQEGPVAFGHRRLNIIDLENGGQPMHDTAKGRVIIFNGEIYNYLELRAELIALGQNFETESDTEVVLKSFDQWGIDCQNKFNGMWSFAIWDKSRQELFLSRDRLGEKPLHYAIVDGALIFASELKSILNFGFPAEQRFELLEIYLTLGNIPAPHTFYKNIFKLMPGHYIFVSEGQLKIRRFWSLPLLDEKRMLSDKKEVYERFSFLLRDSVRIRMRSDVPYGAFLSGGLDSSTIVSIMSGLSREPVKTFTVGFSDRKFDESHLANEVAVRYGTKHFREEIRPQSFKDIIEWVASHHDEPFGDSSSIPTAYISDCASKEVKMVLTGDGGDEVLSGYTSYQGIKLAQMINRFPRFVTSAVPQINNIVAGIFKGRSRFVLNRISNVVRTAGLSFNERMCDKAASTDLANIKRLTSGIPGIWKIEDYMADFMSACTYSDDFYRLMYLNFMHDLPNDYLVKVDRMSMSHSLEARLPFLDHRMIEFMVSVDKNVKMQGWQRKSVLRNSLGKSLPASVLNAPKKGFSVPIHEWFKDVSNAEHLDSNLKKTRHLLHEPTINKILLENTRGEKDNGDFIWILMMLNRFL